MRRALVLVAALAMMWGLSVLRAGVGGGAADPAILAALGFVILAAFTVGELGNRAGLPRVTGYIVAGVLLGPGVSDILGGGVVDEMGVFNTLALGLIATSAGLELDLVAIRSLTRTLVATIGAKLLFLPVLVGAPFLLLHHLWPVLPVAGGGSALALALILSVLAIGTSPAIALAVVNDSGARGRLTDLTLTIAVVKDLVVVVALAGAITVARAFLSGGADIDASVLGELAAELAASLAVGAAVGGLLILYIRFVHREMLLSVLVMILLVAEASHFFHLELLLVFIAAGFVVRNLSEFEHELMRPLARIAVPVYVVFFTTAGAKVDLGATLAILPLAVALTAGRAVAFAAAGRLGAHVGGEPATVGRNAWLAFLPQAGVTLGLVLVAANALPGLATPLLQIGMALVAINLLVGPVTLALGLRRSGELAPVHPPVPVGPEAAVVTSPGQGAESEGPETEPVQEIPTPSQIVAAIDEPLLARELRHLADHLAATCETFVADTMGPLADADRKWTDAAFEETDNRRSSLRRLASAVDQAEAAADERPWDEQVTALVDHLTEHLHQLPSAITVPYSEDLLAASSDDSLVAAWRTFVLRLRRRFGAPPQRTVPVRQLARLALEARLAEVGVSLAAARPRTLATVMEVAADAARGTRALTDACEEGGACLERWIATSRIDLNAAVGRGLAELADTLAVAGSPRLPAAKVRLSRIEGRVRSARSVIRSDGPRWRAVLAACRATLRAEVHLAFSKLVLESVLDRRGLAVVRNLEESMVADLAGVSARLIALRDRVASESDLDSEGWAELEGPSAELYPRALQTKHRRARLHFRWETQPNLLLADLTDIISNAPGGLRVVAETTPAGMAHRPQDVETVELDLADRLEELLLDQLLPKVTGLLGKLGEDLADMESEVRDAVTAATYALELAAERDPDSAQSARRSVVESFDRAEARLSSASRSLADQLSTAANELDGIGGRTSLGLTSLLAERPAVSGERVRISVVATRREIADRLAPVVGALRRRGASLREAVVGLFDQQVLRDLRIRSGHERLDPATVRGYLARHQPSPETLAVPDVVRHLFTTDPLDDRRLFAARNALLEELLVAARAAAAGNPTAILVVGARGSGRSSLVGLLQPKLAGNPVVHLDDSAAVRGDGPTRALAQEAGSSNRRSALIAALRRQRPVVLVDNLERWFLPTVDGATAFSELLQVMTATADRVQWIVTVEENALALIERVVPLTRAFSRVLRLEPLTRAELAAVLAARQRLGGFETVIAATGPRWLGRLRPRGDEASYLRSLRRVSGGNLRSALLAHARAMRHPGALVLNEPVLRALPFLEQLPAEEVAILGLVVRLGPMETESLADILDTAEHRVRLNVLHLQRAGLLESRRSGMEVFDVPLAVEPALSLALGDLGLVTRKEA